MTHTQVSEKLEAFLECPDYVGYMRSYNYNEGEAIGYGLIEYMPPRSQEYPICEFTYTTNGGCAQMIFNYHGSTESWNFPNPDEFDERMAAITNWIAEEIIKPHALSVKDEDDEKYGVWKKHEDEEEEEEEEEKQEEEWTCCIGKEASLEQAQEGFDNFLMTKSQNKKPSINSN